jgi:hypothetical protein
MRLTIRKIACLGLFFCLFAGIAQLSYALVDDRPLPKDGVLGVFSPSKLPAIIIDDKEVKLGAEAQIRNQKNVIVQTTTLKAESNGQDVKILYQKDKLGQIKRIWILTDEEYHRVKYGAPPKPLPPIRPSTPATPQAH